MLGVLSFAVFPRRRGKRQAVGKRRRLRPKRRSWGPREAGPTEVVRGRDVTEERNLPRHWLSQLSDISHHSKPKFTFPGCSTCSRFDVAALRKSPQNFTTAVFYCFTYYLVRRPLTSWCQPQDVLFILRYFQYMDWYNCWLLYCGRDKLKKK